MKLAIVMNIISFLIYPFFTEQNGVTITLQHGIQGLIKRENRM
jgi:hypothetical protein